MRRSKLWIRTALILGIGLIQGVVGSADDSEGIFTLGYRIVDVDGSVREFEEDINQKDGPVLFRLDLDIKPGTAFADRIEVRAQDIGGQSFEALHFAARRYGEYKFEYSRRESDYSYHDILGLSDGSSHPDFHTFDFRRVRDVAKLDLLLSDQATLTFGLDRFTRSGESTTSVDISRDEFEFDRPIDETMDSFSAGLSYAWDKVTLVLEERVRNFENLVEIFLPGASEGEAPGPATLDFFFLDQPYDYSSQTHSARVLSRPTEKLDIRLSASFEDLDLDLDASESSKGTSFQGASFTTDLSGSGEISRNTELVDLDVTYLINDRFGVVGSVRSHSLDQEGALGFGTNFNSGSWSIDTLAFEAGLRCSITEDLSGGAGVLVESREVDSVWEHGSDGKAVDSKTDLDGYWADLVWRPDRSIELSAKIDLNSFDDPFTLTSPTDRSRYSLRGRYRWESGLYLHGSWLLSDYENNNSGWDSETTRSTLRLGYSRSDLMVSFGYSVVEMEREIAHLVTGGALRPFFDIAYASDSDFLDGRVRWSPDNRWTVGGSFRIYENDGSFALERDDYRAFVEFALSEHYVGGLTYRQVEYDEAAFDFEDYEAEIIEISIGYRL